MIEICRGRSNSNRFRGYCQLLVGIAKNESGRLTYHADFRLWTDLRLIICWACRDSSRKTGIVDNMGR